NRLEPPSRPWSLAGAALDLGDERTDVVVLGPARDGVRVEIAIWALGLAVRNMKIERKRGRAAAIVIFDEHRWPLRPRSKLMPARRRLPRDGEKPHERLRGRAKRLRDRGWQVSQQIRLDGGESGSERRVALHRRAPVPQVD